MASSSLSKPLYSFIDRARAPLSADVPRGPRATVGRPLRRRRRRRRRLGGRTTAAGLQGLEVGGEIGELRGRELRGLAVRIAAAAAAEAIEQRRRAAIVEVGSAGGHVHQRRRLEGAGGAHGDLL